VAASELIALNRSEHMYWAAEGYLGPINQAYILRFHGPVAPAVMRQALRELTTSYPRMRSVVEPAGLRYRLRILHDDACVDQLFADTFRVLTHIDASSREALEAFHGEFVNEPISLERGLPWRARFMPHPTQPALMFSVHHIVGDGRSMIQMLSAIMARLSGQPMAASKIDKPSMLPAVMPHKWWQWPATVLRWWRDTQADKAAHEGLNIVTLNRRHSPRYTTTSVRYHELPCPSDAMKALAKANGTTVNTLLTALIANTFLTMAPEDAQAAAALRISVDLRRYYPEGTAPVFGNFVHSFTVLAQRQPTLQAQIHSLESQVKVHLARYESRNYAPLLLLLETLPLLGRTLFGHLIVQAKVKGTLPRLSCHLSNLGNAEGINPPDAQVRLTELWPLTVCAAFLIVALSLNGKQFLTLTSQDDEIPADAVINFRTELDKQFQQLMKDNEAA
jgi:NRPS condensation-like uncharacterized protein